MKKRLLTAFEILLLIVGVCVAMYPLFSDIKWSRSENDIRAEAIGLESDMPSEEAKAMLESAYRYNEWLAANRGVPYVLNDDEIEMYSGQMGGSSSDVIGHLSIPALDVECRIFKGTADAMLMVGVGHCEWSSLPVGGTSTHCVLSGHSGMVDYKMFDGLDNLGVGDHVFVTTLGITCGYEVISKETVLPDETGSLGIVEGEDLLTLVTCVPYGVNSHRLLVHCERCGHQPEQVEAESSFVGRVMTRARNTPLNRWLPATIAGIAVVSLIVYVIALKVRRKGKSADPTETEGGGVKAHVLRRTFAKID